MRTASAKVFKNLKISRDFLKKMLRDFFENILILFEKKFKRFFLKYFEFV